MNKANVKSMVPPLAQTSGAETHSRLGGVGVVSIGDIQTEKEEIPNRPELTAEQAFHQVFWPAYPRKTAKYTALQSWRKLKLADDDQETLDHIMRGLQHYLEHEWELDRPRFIARASTWLNQRCWEDVE